MGCRKIHKRIRKVLARYRETDGEGLKYFVGIDAMHMSLSLWLSQRPIKMLLIANTGV